MTEAKREVWVMHSDGKPATVRGVPIVRGSREELRAVLKYPHDTSVRYVPAELEQAMPPPAEQAAVASGLAQLLMKCADYLDEYPTEPGRACGKEARRVCQAIVQALPPEPEQAGKAEALESLGQATCAGQLETSIRDLVGRLEFLVAEEQARPLPQNHLIAALCDAIRLAREEGSRWVAEAGKAQVGWVRLEGTELVNQLTRALRLADGRYQETGGSTRHYVRECLVDELGKAGLAVIVAPPSPPTRKEGA